MFHLFSCKLQRGRKESEKRSECSLLALLGFPITVSKYEARVAVLAFNPTTTRKHSNRERLWRGGAWYLLNSNLLRGKPRLASGVFAQKTPSKKPVLRCFHSILFLSLTLITLPSLLIQTLLAAIGILLVYCTCLSSELFHKRTNTNGILRLTTFIISKHVCCRQRRCDGAIIHREEDGTTGVQVYNAIDLEYASSVQ